MCISEDTQAADAFQRTHKQQSTSVCSPWTCSTGEKWTFIVWNHWIVGMFVIPAKATLALSYSTFLYCSYPTSKHEHCSVIDTPRRRSTESSQLHENNYGRKGQGHSLIQFDQPQIFHGVFFFSVETSFFTWLLVDSSLTRGTVLAFPCLGNRRWDGRQQITLLWELKVSISPHFKWQCPNPHCGYIGRWSL